MRNNPLNDIYNMAVQEPPSQVGEGSIPKLSITSWDDYTCGHVADVVRSSLTYSHQVRIEPGFKQIGAERIMIAVHNGMQCEVVIRPLTPNAICDCCNGTGKVPFMDVQSEDDIKWQHIRCPVCKGHK